MIFFANYYEKPQISASSGRNGTVRSAPSVTTLPHWVSDVARFNHARVVSQSFCDAIAPGARDLYTSISL